MPTCKLLTNRVSVPLMVHGQGVFLFKELESEYCIFTIYNGNKTSGIEVNFSNDGVFVSTMPGGEPLVDPSNTSGLVDFPGAFYWFSLDSQNQMLYAGVGEPRLETSIFTYAFPAGNLRESNKAFLESLTHVVIKDSSLMPMKLLRDPITATVPLLVADTAHLTMDDVATGDVMPVANLPTTSQKLYNCIAGPKFCLSDELYAAIEHSIATPGCWCYETLKKKATEFNKDKPNVFETYLRITLGQNNGESPGIPYVMEIWPSGHFSPVHSHAGAEAVIRVLEGDINVELFPFLCSGVEPFADADFKKGDVMWISPMLNQIHQLRNNDSATCVTIQCYMYDGADDKHYDYFDYLDADGKIQQYEPDSDMDYVAFKELMLKEWPARPQWCCGRRR